MESIPSIGDVLMLSQVAWRAGRAFTGGNRKTSPREFLDVEDELNRLSKSLKALAESLFSDETESFVSQADRHSQEGVAAIFLSCKRTLDDLESYIEHNQVIRKNKTLGGYTIERSWSNLVLSNYRNMMWTAEGGSIYNLRDMLAMHGATIAMLRSILERSVLFRSLYVGPMLITTTAGISLSWNLVFLPWQKRSKACTSASQTTWESIWLRSEDWRMPLGLAHRLQRQFRWSQKSNDCPIECRA
jgi:hypothetical protein